MPELPEVETIRRGLEKSVVGKTIENVEILHPAVVRGDKRAFVSSLTDQTLQSMGRHGKKLFLNFPTVSVSVHLRMTGQTLLFPIKTKPIKHTHLVLRFTDQSELHYNDIRRFGRWEMDSGNPSKVPDAWLASDTEIIAALKNRSGMIKHALLSQNVIAGLGNIYVDEALHKIKVHPKRRLETLKEKKLIELCAAIKVILKKSIGIGGTSFRNYVDTEGRRGGFKNWLFAYGKQGTPCVVCGTTIKRMVVAMRGTHFCPKCQPAPRAR